ncbi:putative quinol monooxygenase [Chitinasiproducens palmae]|uniref:Quinol monooxygenase YgiN n=1 Tax=Chitinasiproducens palmae TaxID=1770053 RepID=A0A1H2PKE2_9BURK|nr:putative quinol monooxygenase [Chitinasiproducens palmae]SDV46856.1 Quinol monooxygenase YgiN [Chitinasiproducens palmae]
MLIVAVTFDILPAHRADFRDAVVENARVSLEREPECHVFDVCEDRDAARFFLYEQYTDDAAFDAHLATPHFQSFDRLSAPWIVGKTVARYALCAG